MCRRKSSKNKLKELIWGSRLCSCKIEFAVRSVKPCIIQLTHQTPKRGLESLPCNGSASTYTATSRWLLSTPTTRSFLNFWITKKDERKKERARDIMTPTTLNRHALDCAPLDIPLPQRLVTMTPIGNSYIKINWPIWPIYGSGAGYLLSRRYTANFAYLPTFIRTLVSVAQQSVAGQTDFYAHTRSRQLSTFVLNTRYLGS